MRRARPRMSRDAPLLYALCKGSFRVRRSLDQHSDLVRSRWNLRIVGVLGQANVFFLAGEGCLRLLEYRSYDSAGIAIVHIVGSRGENLHISKSCLALSFWLAGRVSGHAAGAA